MGADMGFVKGEWMDAQGLGYSAPDTFVCDNCVSDSFLKELVRREASAHTCNYCNRHCSTNIAASSEVIMMAIYETVNTYFAEPATSGVPYDNNFMIEPIGIDDVLGELGLDGHQDFLNAVIKAEINGNSFVRASNGYWAGSHPHEVLASGWSLFCDVIKHETRFHFANKPRSGVSSPFEIDVADVLPAIAEWLRPQIQVLEVGTKVYRARVRARDALWLPSPDQMGPPPKEQASAGRMNPAGIPYLYTAFDKTTAKCEAPAKKSAEDTVYVAVFEINRPLLIMNFTTLPSVISIFDVENKRTREQALIVRDFVQAISIPTKKDGREHIDYLPSQVVCEYLAQIFAVEAGKTLDGLIYPSSTHYGGKNLVVFPEDRQTGTFSGVTFIKAEPMDS